ncbi:hypothetical protein SAMN05421841_3648 [Chryseobacterium wanjuense]|jgi:hypothetical protein|uniref:Lipoprotein n=1 Tax=Chryseobacterium wanjuense TaxID=356305 RepID=A0A1I0S120_9FLAO|nr:hypothetical protein [Chryseobacterium wanjuense]SEW47864.1 hypothetical protein SAMN05421841_3648 [Chryseobacterium wanjuense]
MGRSKIKNVCLLLPLLLSIIACGHPDFDKLGGTGFSYQISAGKTDIVRVRFTTDEGAPSIQLFDTKGNLKEEATIAPYSGLGLTAMKNDTIQMTYFVGENDQMFLSWFKKNKYNPTRIGNYSIRYNYKVRNVYFMDQDPVQVDSLYIDKNTQMMSLFLKQKLIAKKPMYLFRVKSSEITLYDPSSESNIPYIFADNEGIVEEYLKEILALY